MKNLDNYIDIASFLNDGILTMKYHNMKERLNNGKFLLPVVGQFSSGKSHFINNFLGEDILPVKVTEATAFLTYIEYSEEPFVMLFDKNGKSVSIEQSKLKDLYESNLKDKSINDILGIPLDFEIYYLQVGANHELLKNGVVLVDTPGLNTTNKHHEQITFDVFEKADYFIYVLRKSITDKDLELIKQVQSLGTNVVIVRTRIDEINRSEESIDEVINHEKELLQNKLGIDDYYPLSNIDWDKDINSVLWENLRSTINRIFNKDLKELLVISTNEKLIIDKETLQSQLLEKKKLIESNSELSIEEVSEQKKIVEKHIKLAKFDNDLELNNFSVKDDALIRINKERKTIEETGSRKFEIDVKKCTDTEEAIQLAGYIFENNTEKLNESLSVELTEIAQQFEKIYNSKLNGIDGLTLNTDTSNIYFSIENIEESNSLVEYYLNQLNEFETRISSNKIALEDTKESKESANSNLQSIEEETKIVGEELKTQMASYHRQYIIEKGEKKSGIWKKAGMVLDIATLFIPASAAAGAGKAIMNGGKFLSKGKNAVKVINTLKKVDKTGKLLKNAQKGLKAVEAGAKALGKFGEFNKLKANGKFKSLKDEHSDKLEKAGILDYLTFEHWFEKAGKYFDEPDKRVIDKEYEDEYKKQTDNIQWQYDEAKQDYLRKRYELEDAISEEKKQILELEYDKKNAKVINQKIDKAKLEISISQNNKNLSEYSRQFISLNKSFLDKQIIKIGEYLEKTENEYKSFVSNNVNIKLDQYNVELIKREEELKGIKSSKNEDLASISNYLEIINE